MSVSITIRGVPNSVRDELASRAASSGRSLQEYLVAELTELAARPSLEDALREVRSRAAAYPGIRVEEIVADLDANRH